MDMCRANSCPTTAKEGADIIKARESVPLPSWFPRPLFRPPPSSLPTFHEIDDDEQGCCFQIGFGSYMRPCCLQTSMESKEECLEDQKLRGGAIGFNATCPSSAQEAYKFLRDGELHGMYLVPNES